ncbi:MAG: hypothetical protein V4736_02580 [Bdellovibrionota bacterium]
MKVSNLTRAVLCLTLLTAFGCAKPYNSLGSSYSGSENMKAVDSNGSPNLTNPANAPVICGASAICFAGKMVTFSNDIGNSVGITVSGILPLILPLRLDETWF